MITKIGYRHNKQDAFTLLEVLIAITLTGLVMGSLFAMQSQNKQLTFRSLSALDRLTEQRAVLNSAWLGLKQQKQPQRQRQQNYFIENTKIVDIPDLSEEKQISIKKLKVQLQSVDITDSSHQILFSTMRVVDKKQ